MGDLRLEVSFVKWYPDPFLYQLFAVLNRRSFANGSMLTQEGARLSRRKRDLQIQTTYIYGPKPWQRVLPG